MPEYVLKPPNSLARLLAPSTQDYTVLFALIKCSARCQAVSGFGFVS